MVATRAFRRAPWIAFALAVSFSTCHPVTTLPGQAEDDSAIAKAVAQEVRSLGPWVPFDWQVANSTRLDWRVADSARRIADRFGIAALPVVVKKLPDENKAVQYWSLLTILSIAENENGRGGIRVPGSQPARERVQAFGAIVPDIARLLKSPDEHIREVAVDTLGSIRHENAVPVLMPALQDPALGVRISACIGLEAMGYPQDLIKIATGLDPKTPNDYAFLLTHESATVAGRARRRLRELGDMSVPILLEIARAGTMEARMAAMRILGEMRSRDAVPVLSSLLDLQSSDPGMQSLQSTSIAALASIGTADALGAIEKRGLTHSILRLRLSSAKALINTKERATAVSMLSALGNDPDPKTRLQAAAMLATNGEKQGISVLIELLGTQDPAARRSAERYLVDTTGMQWRSPKGVVSGRDREEYIGKWRRWWQENERSFKFHENRNDTYPPAGHSPPTSALPSDPGLRTPINALSAAAPEDRVRAIESIGKMGDRGVPAIPYLIRSLEDTEPIRDNRVGIARNPCPAVAAAHALEEIGEPAVNALVDALRRNSRTRLRVMMLLGRMKDVRAFEPLVQCLSHGDGDVRTHAAEALHMLTSQNFGEDAAQWKEWWEKNKTDLLKTR